MQEHDTIRDRAYAIWEMAGKPDGLHEEHWMQASAEATVPSERDGPSAPDAD